MGEIESLKASGQARREAVAIMEKQLAAFQAIDAAARSPEQEQAIERLKVQLEGLKATVDPLADKFNTLFSDAAGSALGDFVTGTKTAKEAFRDFANTVVSEITRMAAKDLAKSLFGGGGNGGFNFGSLLSGLFGGGSAGGGGDALGAFISAKGFALGGFTGMGAANDPAGIVHKGEYVLTAEQTKRIGVSNLDRGNFGGSVVNINQTFAPGTDRRTTDQAARSASMQIQRAGRNA
jgi:lambda family phage tail tape measure protein